MGDDLISVADAAKALGRHKQSIFKIIDRLKIEKVLIKSEDARGQKKTVIDCLTEDSEKVYTEVFRVEDVDRTIRKAEAFFELMPALVSGAQ